MNLDQIIKIDGFQSILYSLVDVIDTGIHIIDIKGRTIVYNKKMAEIEGMDSEEVLGKKIHEIFKFKEETESTLIRALHSGRQPRTRSRPISIILVRKLQQSIIRFRFWIKSKISSGPLKWQRI